jgi:hypothetical protein
MKSLLTLMHFSAILNRHKLEYGVKKVEGLHVTTVNLPSFPASNL